MINQIIEVFNKYLLNLIEITVKNIIWYLGLGTKNIVFFVSCVLQNALLISWFCVQIRLEKAAQFTTSFLDICSMNIASKEVKKFLNLF